MARLREVGKVRSSSLETREVSRMLSDAEVVKRNLEQALAHYEELLAKPPTSPKPPRSKEASMRVRTELDRVKGGCSRASA
ncbi:MAG TPA: hypothetical protein VEQ58_19430 [Polyangiaceae bacterium]|nr:hypothetical protein [Polyangiaceae bacterium]